MSPWEPTARVDGGWGRLRGCRADVPICPLMRATSAVPRAALTCTVGGVGLPGARRVPSLTAPSSRDVSACMHVFSRDNAEICTKGDQAAGGRQAGEDKFISVKASGERARSFSEPSHRNHLILNLDKLDLALKATQRQRCPSQLPRADGTDRTGQPGWAAGWSQ